ncbi:MAG: hypothetical protein HQ523_07370 [Lentisphaerae bacterium]|nr:hypothetical protein [Lentisphaerota bacterium]
MPYKSNSIVIIATVVFAVNAFAGVRLTEEPVDGATTYRLENERVSLVINPQRGGAVTSYRDKGGDNVELVAPGKPYGMCMDHFQEQNWPGELMDVPYDARIVTQDADACAVEVSRRVTGDYRGDVNEKLKDIQLVKTYTLRADSPALRCEVVVSAPANRPSSGAYWLQSIAYPGGAYESRRDFSYRPSTRGVRAKSGDFEGQITGGEDFLKDAVDGWIGMIDRETMNGYVMLCEYDKVRFLYCNSGSRTVELMFLPCYLPAGASETYTTWVVPVAGLENVVAATPDYVAGYRMSSDGEGNGELELSVVRSVHAAPSLTIAVTIESVTHRARPDEDGRERPTSNHSVPARSTGRGGIDGVRESARGPAPVIGWP